MENGKIDVQCVFSSYLLDRSTFSSEGNPQSHVILPIAKFEAGLRISCGHSIYIRTVSS